MAGGTTDATHSADLFVPTSSSFVPTAGSIFLPTIIRLLADSALLKRAPKIHN